MSKHFDAVFSQLSNLAVTPAAVTYPALVPCGLCRGEIWLVRMMTTAYSTAASLSSLSLSAFLPVPASVTYTPCSALHSGDIRSGQISSYSPLQVISALIALLPFASHAGWLFYECNSSALERKNNCKIIILVPQVTKNVENVIYSDYVCDFWSG